MVWGSKNVHEIKKASCDSKMITMWSMLSINSVFGLYYFDELIVTSNIYMHLLNSWTFPILSDLTAKTIFQHDEAHLHHSRTVRDLLDMKMSDSWIERGGSVNSPARSPDSTSLDFFRSFMKDNVSRTSCTSLNQLKRRIISTLRNIKMCVLQKVWQTWKTIFLL